MPFQKGHISWNNGLKGCFSKELCRRWSKMKQGKSPSNLLFLHSLPRSQQWKNRISQSNSGKKHWNYKDGRTKTKWYKRLCGKTRKALVRNAGKLSIKVVQLVYEDNIKQYGTLTCYLCLKPIKFGDDNLEHKKPLIRGGNHDYFNLGVACANCNHKKHKKTEEEFKNYMKVHN